jgi:hypothetical protein
VGTGASWACAAARACAWARRRHRRRQSRFWPSAAKVSRKCNCPDLIARAWEVYSHAYAYGTSHTDSRLHKYSRILYYRGQLPGQQARGPLRHGRLISAVPAVPDELPSPTPGNYMISTIGREIDPWIYFTCAEPFCRHARRENFSSCGRCGQIGLIRDDSRHFVAARGK